MGRLNNDEQFKFLISCIRHSNNGKVDFGEVAAECNIISKGAAAKRYERLMKAHGIHQPVNTARDTAVPPMRSKESTRSKETKKKRKLEEVDQANAEADSDDGSSKKVKSEPSDETSLDEPTIKDEEPAEQDYPWLSYPPIPDRSAQAANLNAYIANGSLDATGPLDQGSQQDLDAETGLNA